MDTPSPIRTQDLKYAGQPTVLNNPSNDDHRGLISSPHDDLYDVTCLVKGVSFLNRPGYTVITVPTLEWGTKFLTKTILFTFQSDPRNETKEKISIDFHLL